MNCRRRLVIASVAFAVAGFHPGVSAQTTYTVYGFDQSVPAATQPITGVIRGSDGAFYGTTQNSNFCGAVYRLAPDGTRTVLHVFSGHFANPSDGCQPRGELVEGPDGMLYGTTGGGGANADPSVPSGLGTIYRISKAGDAYEVLYSFSQRDSISLAFPDGFFPEAGLTLGQDGATLYGTTQWGGTGGPDGTGGGCTAMAGLAGTFFRFAPPFSPSDFQVLHSFNPSSDGCGPTGNLTRLSDGSFVGATIFGGYTQTAAFAGTVFHITPSGEFTRLFRFPGNPNDGYPFGNAPISSPIAGPDGSLHGTASGGGPPNGGNEAGTIYKLTFSGGSWQATRLHAFTGPDAAFPKSGLTLGADGMLYGVTSSGGTALGGGGTLFRISPAAVEDSPVELLRAFSSSPNDGYGPEGRLLEAEPGVFVGTTVGGNGTAVGGSVFKFDLGLSGATSTILSASTRTPQFGQAVTLTATVSSGAGTPTGQVEFFDGATSLGAASLIGGSASLSVSSLTVGTHAVTTEYAGDGSFLESESEPVTVTVSRASTTTTLAASTTSAVVGQSVTFTATVSSANGTPSGQMQFFDGAIALGPTSLNGGQAILLVSAAGVGAHSISARYVGDGNFADSQSGAVTVNVAQAATTTTISAAPNPAARKQMVTVRVTVAAVSPGAGTATDQVQLMEGKKRLGTATLVNGVATFQVSFNNMGDHVLTATYAGDFNYGGSTAAAFTQVVSR